MGRGVATALDLVLVILLGLGAAHLIWTLITPTAFAKFSDQSKRSSTRSQVSTLIANPQLLASFDPFNRNLSANAPEVSNDTPQTKLNLVIRSLFSSTDPSKASVRIEMPDGKDKRFQEGDSIISGVTLERILSDRVILLRRGEREVLFASEKRVLDTVREDGQPVIDPTPETKITGTPVKTGASQVAVNLQSFDEFMSKVQLRRQASEDGGQPELVVFSSSDASLLSSAGFEVKDVLLSVNGFDLKDESLSDLASRLKNEKQLDFQIRRNGSVISHTITIGNDGN